MTTVRSVALPTEHGGWSLTVEPVLMGLIVEPSWGGAALGLVTLLAFLLRTPAKLALVDRWRGRTLPRTRMARRVAFGELALIAVLLVLVAVVAEGPGWWWPLAAATPLIATELWFDMRSRSRALMPELAGSVGVSSMAAAIALAGGAATAVAVGLWSVAGARAVAAIPFVRQQLRRAKGQPFRRAAATSAQAAAVMIVAIAAGLESAPIAALVAMVGLAVVHVGLLFRPVPPVPVLGAQQVVVGLTVVLTTALGAVAQFR